eukprot:TRINITY_DN2403_c0_g1_i1.p1 TRINITY_DN2403_c0_g1~~TRINITY_DN2403_c0_g1_i1.p1  ORF type:complete len:759 (+),score=133.40 TRINITY_DN2403_c0_g1_i1:240-2516(+)
MWHLNRVAMAMSRSVRQISSAEALFAPRKVEFSGPNSSKWSFEAACLTPDSNYVQRVQLQQLTEYCQTISQIGGFGYRILNGQRGSGKSHILTTTALNLWKEGWTVLYLRDANLLNNGDSIALNQVFREYKATNPRLYDCFDDLLLESANFEAYCAARQRYEHDTELEREYVPGGRIVKLSLRDVVNAALQSEHVGFKRQALSDVCAVQQNCSTKSLLAVDSSACETASTVLISGTFARRGCLLVVAPESCTASLRDDPRTIYIPPFNNLTFYQSLPNGLWKRLTADEHAPSHQRLEQLHSTVGEQPALLQLAASCAADAEFESGWTKFLHCCTETVVQRRPGCELRRDSHGDSDSAYELFDAVLQRPGASAPLRRLLQQFGALTSGKEVRPASEAVLNGLKQFLLPKLPAMFAHPSKMTDYKSLEAIFDLFLFHDLDQMILPLYNPRTGERTGERTVAVHRIDSMQSMQTPFALESDVLYRFMDEQKSSDVQYVYLTTTGRDKYRLVLFTSSLRPYHHVSDRFMRETAPVTFETMAKQRNHFCEHHATRRDIVALYAHIHCPTHHINLPALMNQLRAWEGKRDSICYPKVEKFLKECLRKTFSCCSPEDELAEFEDRIVEFHFTPWSLPTFAQNKVNLVTGSDLRCVLPPQVFHEFNRLGWSQGTWLMDEQYHISRVLNSRAMQARTESLHDPKRTLDLMLAAYDTPQGLLPFELDAIPMRQVRARYEELKLPLDEKKPKVEALARLMEHQKSRYAK